MTVLRDELLARISSVIARGALSTAVVEQPTSSRAILTLLPSFRWALSDATDACGHSLLLICTKHLPAFRHRRIVAGRRPTSAMDVSGALVARRRPRAYLPTRTYTVVHGSYVTHAAFACLTHGIKQTCRCDAVCEKPMAEELKNRLHYILTRRIPAYLFHLPHPDPPPPPCDTRTSTSLPSCLLCYLMPFSSSCLSTVYLLCWDS